MDNQNLKDHRQIGRELELFFNHEISPGAVFWLPKGMVIFKELEKYIREVTSKADYQETSTPIIVKNQIFKQSGHWEKFGEHNMFNLSIWEDEEKVEILNEIEDELEKMGPKVYKGISLIFNFQGIELKAEIDYAEVKQTNLESKVEMQGVRISNFPVNFSLKPMNCPESTILFKFRQRSYKELPLRFSELGRLSRREKSGEINGLLRVRQLTMDDAHIYCTHEQIFDEVSKILDSMIDFYKSFGFEYEFRFATRPETRAGTDQMWDEAEKDLAGVLKEKGIKAGDKQGDGAFYGPKIDMHIKDAHGREWQLATVQLDFHQPKALGVAYVDKDGTDKTPVMVHRAIFGSFERFIAVLTEHYQGAFPLWLSPVQVAVLPVSEKVESYAKKIYEQLKKEGLRTEFDTSDKPIGAKIREATLQKMPYMCIIGTQEEAESAGSSDFFVSIRTREGKDLGKQKLNAFIERLKEDIAKRI